MDISSILSIGFWGQYIWYGVALFLSCYIPGDIFLKPLTLPRFSRAVLATIVGVVFWIIQGIVFGYLNARWGTYAYLAVFLLIWGVKKHYRNFSRLLLEAPRRILNMDKILLVVLLIGVGIQMIPMWGNGLQIGGRPYYCCGDTNDNFYHIGLTRAIIRHFPPYEPGMHGVSVQGYHYWSNVFVAELSRIFRIDVTFAFFQGSLLVMSILLGLVSIVAGYTITGSISFTRWLLFLVYFGGDAIYMLSLMAGKGFHLMTLASSLEDGAKFFVNPPRAYAYIIALAALVFFHLWTHQQKRRVYVGMISVLLITMTAGIKIYIAIFLLIGLCVAAIDYLRFGLWRNLWFPLACAVGAVGVFLLVKPESSGSFVFVPFFIVHNFIAQPHLGLIRWELAREIYYQHNNIPRIMLQEFQELTVFIAAIFGSKLIGFLNPRAVIHAFGRELGLLLFGGIIGSSVMGLLFLQNPGGANTFNFLVSSWLFLSFPTAMVFTRWSRRFSPQWYKMLAIGFVLLTIPRVLYASYETLSHYISGGGFGMSIADSELFYFLRNKVSKGSIILIDESSVESSYMPAFIDQKMYLSGQGILDSHGIDSTKRRQIVHSIYNDQNPFSVGELLIQNNIDYFLVPHNNILAATEVMSFSDMVFRSDKLAVYKVDREKLLRFISESRS